MPRFRQLIALAVLTLWLPATWHCTAEAAGLLSHDCCASTTQPAAAPNSCADDACDIAEGACPKPQSFATTAPAPLLVLCLPGWPPVLPPLALVDRAGPGGAAGAESPPEPDRPWIFLLRAAPAPRAPSLAA